MITVKNIRAGYDGNEILHNVSFSLSDDENLSIIGPNGCGKTTLLRTLSATIPYLGEIQLDGADIKQMNRKALAKKVSMMSQITHIYFNYTVMDTVLMGRYVHSKNSFFGDLSNDDRLCAEEALKTVGLLDLKNREVDTLSGGQLQRVFLAKLIAQNPDIILLDEPTNHLDLSHQIELIKFLKKWSEENNKTVVGVFHDINLAMALTDNVLLLENGNIKSFGKCRDVFTSAVLNEVYKMDIASYMLETLRKWEDILSLDCPAR